MNYGITLIVIGCLNFIIEFSGIPVVAQKVLIIAISLVIIFIGLIFRTKEQRRKKRIAEKLNEQAIEQSNERGTFEL